MWLKPSFLTDPSFYFFFLILLSNKLIICFWWLEENLTCWEKNHKIFCTVAIFKDFQLSKVGISPLLQLRTLGFPPLCKIYPCNYWHFICSCLVIKSNDMWFCFYSVTRCLEKNAQYRWSSVIRFADGVFETQTTVILFSKSDTES